AEADRVAGGWSSAEAVARGVLASEPQENLLERVEASFLLARLASGRGRLEEAARVLRDLDAPRFRSLLGSPEALLPLAVARTECEVEGGRADAAWTALAPALDEGARNRPTFLNAVLWSNALYLGVALAVGRNDLGSAARWSAELHRVAAELDEPWTRGWALRAEGLLAQGRGELQDAVGAFERSLAQWETLDWPFETGLTLCLLGEALGAAARPDPASEFLDRAAAVFARLGADRYANRVTLDLRRR
ncbi:MAG TPA: hypothetical protein VEH10_02830, partial [Thermoplasmata archaeon]|nr:hypothetical protein [Thermoplasmata archaeon]